MVQEVGVEVHGGGGALKQAGGGSRPRVPVEAAMAARRTARHTRGGAVSSFKGDEWERESLLRC
jgi:hypothetical protein